MRPPPGDQADNWPERFSYVLTDIVPEYGEDMLAELRAMPVTIRLRMLRSR
jgi:hypothetical protein